MEYGLSIYKITLYWLLFRTVHSRNLIFEKRVKNATTTKNLPPTVPNPLCEK